MKGQSAIEYLMTYGWMLVVVAIAAGVVYATVGERCTRSTSGMSGTDVRLQDFGTTPSGEMQIELMNAQNDPVEITNITLKSPETGQQVSDTDVVRIPAVEKQTASMGAVYFRKASGCNTVRVSVTYSTPGGLQDQIVSGTITSKIEMGATEPPTSPGSLDLTR